MIARCETCPFWKRLSAPVATNYQNNQPWLGVCSKAGDLMYPIPDEDDKSQVVTHKSFGCVMHPMNKAIL